MTILNWNQSELADHSGVNQQKISRVCNRYVVPDDWEQNAIQAALCKHGVFIDTLECWPADFQTVSPGCIELPELEPVLTDYAAYVSATEGARDVGKELLEQVEFGIEAALSKIKARDLVIFYKFTGSNSTLDAIGTPYGMSRERVRQIVNKVGETIKKQIDKKTKEEEKE